MKAVFHEGQLKVMDDNDQAISGAKLTFYDTGTSNLQDTYSDYARTTANTNPVVADSEGRSTIFLKKNTVYDYTLTDSSDVLIYPKFVGIKSEEAPLTTKGDLFTFDTDFQRLGVGTNAQVLTADSSQPTGVKWADQASDATLTTKGDLYAYDTAAARLAVGNDGAILLADSNETTGLKWVNTNLTVTNNATVALASDTWTTITYDTESEDTDNLHNATTYTTTIAAAGWYSVFVESNISGASITSVNMRLVWTPNGAAVRYIVSANAGAIAVSNDDVTSLVVAYLGASDTISVQMLYANASKTLSTGSTYRLRRLA